MNARTWLIATICSAVSLAACSKEDSSSSGPPPGVRITPSATTVVADGVNTVTLTVTDPGGGPITVTTDRGTLPGGGQTATIAGAAGTLALLTCDASLGAGCAGTVNVTATGASSTTSRTLTFGSLASICPTNCDAAAGCASRTCTLASGGSGTCSATSPSACLAAPACAPTAATEVSCTNGADDDCVGGADGADPACEGQPCQAGSSTFLWKSGLCTDITSGLGIKVTTARTRLPADGTARTQVVVEATAEGTPVSDMAVSVSTSLGTLSAATASTGSDGRATFDFTAPAATGVATITASLVAAPSVTASASVTMPSLGAFQLPPDPAQFRVMGAKGSGWNELGWLQVQVLDDAGQPYPDGLAVRFEHHPLGGSTLADPLLAPTAACAAPACLARVSPIASGAEPADSTGLASTMIQTGTVAGPLVVTATATVAGVTRSVTLPTVAVVGAKASGSNFSVVCSPRNLPALAQTDCSISLVDAPFTCEALLKDRFQNVLGTETQVFFASEAGSIGPVVTTPPYAPDGGGADLGVALQRFDTLGAGLPFDVDHDSTSSEPYADHGLDGCGARRHNPRDGVVTIVAVADGEEGFFDANGDGYYEAGEPFVDQGEPFVDQDDDGQHDAGEWFLDLDGDGSYGPANGAWDASARIWTQTVVVYTGVATTLASGSDLLGTRWAHLPLASACTPTPVLTFPAFDVATATDTTAAESTELAVVASDYNLNFLNEGTTYGATVLDGADVEVTYRGLASYADDLGFFYRYRPCADDGAGACAAQCQATGGPYPCVMRPSVAGYSCGLASTVAIAGGADPVASAAVEWDVDVPWKVYGGSRTLRTARAVSGRTH